MDFLFFVFVVVMFAALVVFTCWFIYVFYVMTK